MIAIAFSCRCVLCHRSVALTRSEMELWRTGRYDVVCDDQAACQSRALCRAAVRSTGLDRRSEPASRM